MKTLKEFILESPIGYALWSTPFNKPKIVAIKRVLEKNQKLSGSVLDVGCGPGSNAPVFDEGYDYLGVDFNPKYIESASRIFPKMTFLVGDATKLELNGKKFDIILINSLMHHLDNQGCHKLMTDLKPLLKDSGIITIQEPLIPQKNQRFMTLMMNLDRGDYFRHLADWQNIFNSADYKIVDETFYTMKLLGITGWSMYSALLSAK